MREISSIRHQLLDILRDMYIIESCPHLNSSVCPENIELIRYIICSGLYPNVSKISKIRKQSNNEKNKNKDKNNKYSIVITDKNNCNHLLIHPTSVLNKLKIL